MFLEINVTAPRRPIPVSGDRVTSADDTMKIWISVSVYILVYMYVEHCMFTSQSRIPAICFYEILSVSQRAEPMTLR